MSKRKKINDENNPITKYDYERLSSSEKKYVSKYNLYEIWHDVSEWTPFQTKEILKLRIEQVNDFAPKLFRTYDLPKKFNKLVAPTVTRELITHYNPMNFQSLPKLTEKLACHLYQIMNVKQKEERNPEAPVDAFASFLFDTLDFGMGGLLFRPKPKQVMQYRDVEIVAIPDFGVRQFNNTDIFLLLEESKPHGIKAGFDHQVMGQLFVFAWAKYEITGKDVDLFSIVLSGTYVIFYYVNFDKSYMKKIKEDKIPEEKDSIIVYKSLRYDFLEEAERREILSILFSIKEKLLTR